MQKFFYLAASLLLLCAGFTACSDDDDAPNPPHPTIDPVAKQAFVTIQGNQYGGVAGSMDCLNLSSGETLTDLFLTYLQDFINTRHEEMPEGSYTTSLFKDGINRMAQKVGEEALEAVIEACNGTNGRRDSDGRRQNLHGHRYGPQRRSSQRAGAFW